MEHLIRSASLTGYVQVAEQLGLDPDAMLASVGLARRVLSDPDTPIAARAVGRLLEASARLSGADDFGLRIAESRLLSNLGPLGLVARQAPTLRGMLDAMARYLRLHNESLVLHVEASDGVVILSQTLSTGRAPAGRQSIELGVGALHQIIRSVLADAWRPISVHFVHAPPRSLATHRRVFGTARLVFRAEFDGIACHSADLDRAIPDADPMLHRHARRYLDGLVQRAGGADPISQVRHLVGTLLPSGRCTVERVAACLAIDRRTVHRRLAREGTTWSALLDEVRAALALRHVESGDRPLGDVALLTGFAHQSAFSGWFRQRFGCSPSEWRARGALAARRPAAESRRPGAARD